MKTPTRQRRHAAALRMLAVVTALLSSPLLNAAPALDFNLATAHLENQSVTGTLGWQFTVNQAITVTHLGLFDLGQDGLVESHSIGIWGIGGGSALFQSIIPAGSATVLEGNFRYIQIPDAILQPGNYVIGAQYVAISADTRASDASGITTDPRITYVGARYGAGSNLPFPNTATGVGHYFGPNFQIAPVPEPSTVALFGIGGIALIVRVLRKRRV